MSNTWFRFRQFTVQQERCAMKVTTDACLFGAWLSRYLCKSSPGNPSAPCRALDIGTGTGLLSLMLAQQCRVMTDAIEIDRDACEQAMENVAHSPWPQQIRVVHGDIKQFPADRLYDVVISNPPFYENELRSADEKKNIAHHGHQLGLAELFAITRQQLADKGQFFFLFPFKRKTVIEKLLAEHGLFVHEMVLVRQSVRHDLFRIMLCGGLEETELKTSEMAIKDERDQYTPAFTDLLKDYYLYL
ncbi:MAG: methyltransferase [Chitinophagaceae bacterium]